MTIDDENKVLVHHTECTHKGITNPDHICKGTHDQLFPTYPYYMSKDEFLRTKELVDEINGNARSEGKESYRVPIAVRYDLIPPVVLEALAEVYEEGARKYGPSKYLEKPLPYSVIVNHMMNHLIQYWKGDRSERHLAKVIWGAAAMITLDAVKDGNTNDLFIGGKRPNVE